MSGGPHRRVIFSSKTQHGKSDIINAFKCALEANNSGSCLLRAESRTRPMPFPFISSGEPFPETAEILQWEEEEEKTG